MSTSHSSGSAIANSLITGFVALVPSSLLTHAEKVLWVLVLAMVAELGRRTIGYFWKENKK
jgi:hypothetical protein